MARKGKEELHCSHFPRAAFTSRRCHGDRLSEHDCAVRQTRRKGRRDVVLSPAVALALPRQKLQFRRG